MLFVIAKMMSDVCHACMQALDVMLGQQVMFITLEHCFGMGIVGY